MSYGDPYLNPYRDPSDPVEHIWVAPPSEPCPDCPCCSKRLCEKAIEKHGACHWYGGQPGGYDLRYCPCWDTSKLGNSSARIQEIKTAEPHRSYPEIVQQVLNEMGGAS